MSVGRKAIGWAAAGILLAGTAGVGYAVLRPKNDPRVIGALPKGLHLMPRSQFNQKPWFDLPWFGGKRLTYPTNTKMPKGFKDEPDLAAILTWDPPPPPPAGSGIPPTAASSIASLMPVYFGLASWKDESGKVWEQKTTREFYGNMTWSADYATIPYVYGDRPRRFEVTWFDLTPMVVTPLGSEPPRVSMTIELPPNHRPAPRENPQDIKVGKWTLHLEPQAQLGPTFARQYLASIREAREGAVFFLDIQDEVATSPVTPGLRVERGKVTRLTLPAKPQSIVLRLEKVAEKPVDLRVKGLNVSGSGYSTFECVVPGSSEKLFGYQISGFIYFQPVSRSGILECGLAGSRSRTSHTFGQTSMETMSGGRDGDAQMSALKEGQVLHCTVARRVELTTAKLKL